MGAVMKHRFCGVFTHKKLMYVIRLANANGPNCMVWPPKPLYSGLTQIQLGSEIENALNDYADLGRPIYAPEWHERSQRLLAFFGEKSDGIFQRKKKDISIRLDLPERVFRLADGSTGKLLFELQSLEEVASKVFELLGPPVTQAPTVLSA